MTSDDERMNWVRHLDALPAASERHLVQAELASEVRIAGVLAYANDAILIGPTTLRPDPSGLYKYQLRLQLPSAPEMMPEGTRRGYLFRDGPVGELVALLSLHLQARIYVQSVTLGELTSHGMAIKTEFASIRAAFGPGVDPIIFSTADRNFATSFPQFLDEVRGLPAEHHMSVALAANHYTRALREIGVDEEMVFVRLVAAVETVAKDESIEHDPLAGCQLESLIRTDTLTGKQVEELSKTFAVRKAKARFVAFLLRHSQTFFVGEQTEPPLTQVTHANLAGVATAIYNARSGYLHTGDPMYLSRHIPQFPDWHMDPSVGMQWGNRTFRAQDKLPRADFFHRLVRHCLLGHLRSLVPAPAG